jgi:membrane protease YdiL (CAAX protease family)
VVKDDKPIEGLLLTTDHGTRTTDSKAWRDLPALAFCLVFPSVMTWLYLVVLGSPGDAPTDAGWAVRVAFGTGKCVQFGFPLLYVAVFERARLRPALPTWKGLGFGLGFGVLVALAMLALYFGWLGSSAAFESAPHKAYRLVADMHCATPGRYLLLATFITVPHSLLEEYYWRWFVFGWLRRYMPLGLAIAVSALGFMAHHTILLGEYFPGGFWTVAVPLSAGVAVGGAVWAWVYARTGSLYAPWLSHLLVDAALMPIGWTMLSPRFAP